MTLTAITGAPGVGKTLLQTYLLAKDYREHNLPIYSNYHLAFPHERVNFEEFLNPLSNYYHNSAIGLDEIWLWMDARNSSSKVNRAVSQIILQSRKMNCILYGTAQDLMQIDKRMRNFLDYIIEPQMHGDIVIFRVHNRFKGTTKKYAIDASPIYSLYDTLERKSYETQQIRSAIQRM